MTGSCKNSIERKVEKGKNKIINEFKKLLSESKLNSRAYKFTPHE
jgi:hypothetical protein